MPNVKTQKAKKDLAIIFGGTGYIGMRASKRLLPSFRKIILADIKEPTEPLPANIVFVECDTRRPIDKQIKHAWSQIGQSPETSIAELSQIDWIFNFSAIHREPGHTFEEYFDTNIPSAENICSFAETYEVANIMFTSSIAVYGPTQHATRETSGKYPSSAYGISKLNAELIHERWQASLTHRRLITCRPGVVYGPEDPGNILRMIQAVKKGLFFFPGNPTIFKSYAYIEGLLDSFEFTMARKENVLRYNYVENPTEPLSDLVKHIESFLHKKSKTISLPLWLLIPAAHIAQLLTNGRSAIHPQRVKKAATPTHIIPQTLIDMGFDFRYDFVTSLSHWRKQNHSDF